MPRRKLLWGAGATVAGALAATRLLGRRGPEHPAGPFSFADVEIFDGERILPGRYDVLVSKGIVEWIRPASPGTEGPDVVFGGALAPGFVDAHVHLSFSRPERVASGGVTAVLDMGSPREFIDRKHAPLRFHFTGPLITVPGGYPTQSWGKHGYGAEVASAEAARNVVETIAGRGAAMIKIAIDGSPTLDVETIRAIVTDAHSRSLEVAAHALTVDAVAIAIEGGIDVLAHTPVEPLPSSLVESLGSRGVAVISTVRAFGASADARANLAALAAAGCPVAYGTDLGNGSIQPGLDAEEMKLVEVALGSKEAALRAATSVAARLCGFEGGRIVEGIEADLVHAASLEYAALARPDRVMIEGIRVR